METKYEIVYDETSCTDWGFVINGQWIGAERLDGVKLPEEDDELLDHVLAKLKEDIKAGHSDFKSLIECIQPDDTIWPEESCDTCGHWGHKTIWKI